MKNVLNRMLESIRTYWSGHGRRRAFVGVSGGKDSTVCLKLMAEALGPDNVYAVELPLGLKKTCGYSLNALGEAGIPFSHRMVFPIDDICKDIANSTPWFSPQADINVKPRVRMTVLYYICQASGGDGFVVNTSNLDELLMGYGTVWGDLTGDYSPLHDFHVSEVIQLGRALDIPWELLIIPPADGLTGKTDEENLGFSYEAVNNLFTRVYEEESKWNDSYDPDWFMTILDEPNVTLDETDKKIVKRFRENQFKLNLCRIPHPRMRFCLDTAEYDEGDSK